jgi:hypothetical protein
MVYKVLAVGSEGANAPRHYETQYGKMVAYKLKLEGSNDIVEISKKDTSPAPKIGDELNGTIEKTEFGHKFKADKMAFNGGGKTYQPKDEAGIKAMWSIGQSVAFHASNTEATFNDIEAGAKKFFAMVDRVKTGEVKTEKPVTKDYVVEDIKDEPIDLSDIPF